MVLRTVLVGKSSRFLFGRGQSQPLIRAEQQQPMRCLSTTRRTKKEHLNGVASEPSESATRTSSTQQQQQPPPLFLQGIVLDHAVNLRKVRIGDRLDIPYEWTVSESMSDFWSAAFFDQSRLYSSRTFGRSMGLQDRALPFSLALFLTSSMSHADAAKVQVGFGQVHYLWPIFAGDTVRKSFTVNQIRNTSDGNHSVIHFTCDLINQRNRLCMRADKQMLFQFPVTHATSTTNGSSTSTSDDAPPSLDTHLFRDHLLSKATTTLLQQPSHSLADLRPGELYLHSMHRSLTLTQSQQLASMARLTHERHFDIRKYNPHSEILIPGGLVLGLTCSASARDFHEVLHEEIVQASYCNALHPENVVGAVSYVSAVDDNLPGNLQVVTVTTLGVKNVHAKADLSDTKIPLALFRPGIFSKEVEQICKESCPILSQKIVVQVQRKILRQARQHPVFLL